MKAGRPEAGFTPLRRSAEHGFTLVEVLVALTIFGLIAAGGVAILSFSVRAQGVTAAKLDDVTALGRAVSILSADLAQAQARPARDERGTLLPAFVGEGASNADPMLRLVRGGWSNLDRLARPTSQKVAYRVVNGTMERISWPMLDGATAAPAAALLTGVREARLRYRFRGAWSARWDGSGPAPLPDAVELRIVRADGRQYRSMFLVGTGYAPDPQEAGDAG